MKGALHELTSSTCGIGTWTLRVIHPHVIEYTYMYQGKTCNGQKLECILLSEDSQSYCMGTVRRSGSTATGEQNFGAMVKKFTTNPYGTCHASR